MDITDEINTTLSINKNIDATNWYSWIFSISWIYWILIILFLALLGINIFAYLAKGTNVLSNITKKIFGATAEVAGNIVDTGAEGAKKVVDTTAGVVNTTAGVIDKGLTNVQNITPNTGNQKETDFLNNRYQPDEPEPNDTEHVGKAGWCYIGTDRGFRSCAKVGVNDTCMSGDIFPSKEICINPSLRV